MINRSLVVYAEDAPMADRAIDGPHCRYKYPRVEVEDRPLAVLAAGMIRLQMRYAGICWTDLHLLETSKNGYVRCSSPFEVGAAGRVIGHEGVGVVCELGAGVEGIQLGDVVSVESIITCMSCEKCRQGAFNQCLRSSLLGMESDGLFAEYADVPVTIAHNVSDLACSEDGLTAC